MIQRLCSILFISLLAAPLLLAQDSPANHSQAANVGGAWQISWEGRRGTQHATIQIQQDGSKLSGTFQDSEGKSAELTGSVVENNISFSVQMQRGRTITLVFTGTSDGDKMSGTLQPQGGSGRHEGREGAQQNHSWSGVRQQSGRQTEPQQQNENEDDELGL